MKIVFFLLLGLLCVDLTAVFRPWRNSHAVMALLLAVAVVVTGLVAFRKPEAPEETGPAVPHIPEGVTLPSGQAPTTESTTEPSDGGELDIRSIGSGGSGSEGDNDSTPPPAPVTPPKQEESPAGGNETPTDGGTSEQGPAGGGSPADGGTPEPGPDEGGFPATQPPADAGSGSGANEPGSDY